ncbi:MAG: hypothetical protein QF903_10625 [Planctomycetota bacterium]|nr:hypothetical protein [Planctomycetota bacterium]MDP6989922.1 hypothetical protein [Planctomycetota bacterium]
MSLPCYLLALLPLAGAAQEPAEGVDVPADLGATIARCAELLVDYQEDYSKGDDRRTHQAKARGATEWPYEGVYRVGGDIPMGYRIGGTSIVAGALLEVPGTDRRRKKAVERGLAFVLDALDDEDMAASSDYGYDVRGWGHTYALGFLLRMRALERVPAKQKKEVDRKITWLTQTLLETEIPDSGGWNYSRSSARRRGRGGGEPRPSPASAFMTAPTLLALFEARAQGEEVDEEVVERALSALEGCRSEQGAYPYTTGGGRDAMPGCTARTPVTEVVLSLAGRGDPKRLLRAVEAFHEHWDELEVRRCRGGTHIGEFGIAPYYVMYGHRYVALAIEMLPEQQRPEHRARLRQRLFEIQGREKNGDAGEGEPPPPFFDEPDPGSWNDRVFPRSRNYGTACALLALMQPDLPAPAMWAVQTPKDE